MTLNLILIPKYGMVGAAISNVTAFTVMFLGITWWSQRVFPVPYQWRRVATVVGCAVGLTVLGKALGCGAADGHRADRRLSPLPVAAPLLPAERADVDQAASGANRAVKCRSEGGSSTIR